MASKAGSEDRDISDINVTPFVDIALVLLIILMVTSTHIVKASIQVDLPKAASGGQAVSSTLNVVITKEGTLFLDGMPIDEAALARKVEGEKRTNPDLQAVIAADRGVSYGRVVQVIDLVKTNGVKSFALNIERAPAGAAETP